MFPALVSCCTIDWFDPWPDDALLSVAKKFMGSMEAMKDEERLANALSESCVFIHKSIEQQAEVFYQQLKRKVYTTPKSYLDLIGSYESFLEEKRSQLSNRRNVLFTGLTKLESTNQDVNKMQAQLTEMQPILE